MAKKSKAAPPAKVKVAILDEKDVFQGVTEIDPGQVTELHVLLPDGCDLPTGKYCWDRAMGAFMPNYTREDK